MEISFPKTLDEFKSLVEKLDIQCPEQWTYASEYKEEDIVEFLFLYGLWEYIGKFTPDRYTPESISRYRKWAEEVEFRQFEPYVPITEKLIKKGVTPEEISELVMHEAGGLAFNFCYAVDDTGYYSKDHKNLGLYIEDAAGAPEPEGRMGCLHEILFMARPRSYPTASD
ncbi:hypothetical protein KFE80_02725 [bacterium SCSIO 12696]|nr:hypothetical protein KFE80_02725 [bacterium SCSIO 12696]